MFFELENSRLDTFFRALQLTPICWAEMNPIIQTLFQQANSSEFQKKLSNTAVETEKAQENALENP